MDNSLELNGFMLVEERREDVPGFGGCRSKQLLQKEPSICSLGEV